MSETLKPSMRVIIFEESEIRSSVPFMKLRVLGSIDGKEVSFVPSVIQNDIPPMVGNDHLIPWRCSIHLYPDECRLEIPSRGIDAKLHVTTSNRILVNLADFAGTEEHDYDVWTSKKTRTRK